MSKKILTVLLLLGLVMPMALRAANEIPTSCTVRKAPGEYLDDCSSLNAGDVCTYETDTDVPCGLCCLMGTVLYLTDIVFVVLIVLVIVFVLLGAFNLLVSGGNPEKATAGRNYIMWAMIGLGAAILARAIPNLVTFFIGGNA